jgi:class 3 adenylate cyclase/tetratricopeptide (TPR) repeat protein
MQACPSCGFENAESAKFCSQCGTALAPMPTARREERKVVSVVFADIVGSTARAERLDPEDVRAVLAPYHDRLRHELERRGGTVEKFIGDAVVGVFGAPVAHEDDPERAVRAALSIQEAIAELNDADPALELEVRIGVNTGEALVSVDARPEAGEAMVAGDVMNTAARLQSGAPSGGVLVGDATYRATSRAIDYHEAESIRAKGKSDPVSVWLAVAPRARFGIDVFQTGRAPLVGRERELDLLSAALARVSAESEPQLVTLVGVPGIGKSRLVYELSRIADDDPDPIVWRQGRSLPYGEGVAFWALGEIVKAQAGILESEGAVEAEAKLAAAVSDLLSQEEAAWVERHLRPLLGLGGDTEPGEGHQAEAFAAWRRFFEALAERSPTILVFEDLQWADDGLLEFVDGLVERVAGVPLLVVCNARPELLERRSGWGGGKRNALTISLAPLTEGDTARLLGALLDRPLLPADEQAMLLQRAGGNPLYAEDYARMLEAEPTLGDVPETLQGVVAARIDALPAAEKELLQQAAVFGKVFWTDAVAAVLVMDEWLLEERLHALERKEFIRREHRSAVEGARQHVFVHALVRDSAYGQMPRAARAQAHERVAAWIESLPSDRAEDRAEMRAHHLVQAVEYGRVAGLDVAHLLPKAAEAARDAGDRAWALGAPASALSSYEQSRSLDPTMAANPYLLVRIGRALLAMHGRGDEELDRAAAALSGTDPAAAAEAEVIRGELVWQRGDPEEAFSYFQRAATTVEELAPSRQKLYVVSQVARFLTLAGRNDEGLERAEQAMAMARELGDDDLLTDTLNTRGLARVALGDADGISDIESSLTLALEMNSWRAGRGYLNLGSQLLGLLGDVARADATYREGLEFVERLGFRLSLRWYRGNLTESAFHLGLWDEAFSLAEREIVDPEPHYMQQLCRMTRGLIRLGRDDATGALEDAARAADTGRTIRDPQALLPGLTRYAFCAARLGDKGAAAAVIDELTERLQTLGPAVGLEGPWVTELAFALLELGREAELLADERILGPPTPWRDAALAIARGNLVEAAAVLRATGSAAFEAHARLCAARGLSADGRHMEAEAQLTPALSFYRSVGAVAAVREGEALLAAAS